MATLTLLAEGAAALGVHLHGRQVGQFERLRALLLEHNQRVNLTSITDPEAVEVRHFLDSLTAATPVLEEIRAGTIRRLIDVGSGGGFPGLPIKIAFPELDVTLLEATRKKAAFIQQVVDDLGLARTRVIAMRAEDAGREPDYREQYDWVTARALGPLPVVIELCAPFLGTGGYLVAQRRGDLSREVEAAKRAFNLLRLAPSPVVTVRLPGLDDGRGLVVGVKAGPTPEEYPRRVGVPAKQPLGSNAKRGT